MLVRASAVRKLTQAADFERVLAAPSRARSPHFAVHFLPAMPWVRRAAASVCVMPELSTEAAPTLGEPVDKPLSQPSLVTGVWLGTVVPKRHAKRAVTRSLVKRQMRAAVERHAAGLAQGLWVVRLRSPIDRQQFPSAASAALRRAVQQELDVVLARAAR